MEDSAVRELSGSPPAPKGKPTHKGANGEIYVDSDGKRYKCSSYTRNDKTTTRWYEVDESGARKFGNSLKPSNVPSNVWSRMTEQQKMEEIVKASASVAAAPTLCAPLGLQGLSTGASAGAISMAAQIVAWSNADCKLQEPTGLDDYAVSEARVHELEPEVAPDDQPLPWDAWDAFIEEMDSGHATTTAVNGGGEGNAQQAQ